MENNTIYVCGHTGSLNRGCEALIRSTYKILSECSKADVQVLTLNIADDKQLKVDSEIKNLVSYPQRPFFYKGLYYLERKGVLKGKKGRDYCYKAALKNAKKGDAALNIGGDTYCYGKPNDSYALNDVCKAKNIANIFWGCSIDERLLTDSEMQADVNKYSYIITRESLSFDILSKVVKDKSKIYLTCDPAFWLDLEKTDLPDNFKIKNTVGINVSPMVMQNANDENGLTYKNILKLIDRILTETDMNVCLVPHVYRQTGDRQDLTVLENIYGQVKDKSRVSIIKSDLSCKNLKYIISNCRFFVGARTHSMIAAYSTGVPALAIGYSIKAKGIAKDLFGSYENFAVSWRDLKSENDLSNVFFDNIIKNEREILQRYNDFLPTYKNSIITATREILEKLK